MLGRCCNCECDIAADDFARPDATTPGGDWTVISGDYHTSGERLYCYSGGILRHDTPHPAGASARQVVSLRVFPDSGQATVWDAGPLIAYADDENYLWARLHYDDVTECAELQLRLREPGGLSQTYGLLSVPLANFQPDEWYEITACYKPEPYPYIARFSAILTRESTGEQTLATYDVIGNAVLGARGGVRSTGRCYFDDYRWQYRGGAGDAYDGCPNCGMPCAIGADNFDRDDGPLGCLWESSGTGSQITSGEMQPGALEINRFKLPHPYLRNDQIVTVRANVPSGASALIYANLIGVTTGEGIIWGQFTPGATSLTLSLIHFTGGSPTTLKTETFAVSGTAGTWQTLQLCFTGSIARLAVGESCIAAHVQPANVFPYVGLGATDAAARFDDFTYSQQFADDATECGQCDFCGESDCDDCCDVPPGTVYEVDLGEFVGGDLLPAHCFTGACSGSAPACGVGGFGGSYDESATNCVGAGEVLNGTLSTIGGTYMLEGGGCVWIYREYLAQYLCADLPGFSGYPENWWFNLRLTLDCRGGGTSGGRWKLEVFFTSTNVSPFGDPRYFTVFGVRDADGDLVECLPYIGAFCYYSEDFATCKPNEPIELTFDAVETGCLARMFPFQGDPPATVTLRWVS